MSGPHWISRLRKPVQVLQETGSHAPRIGLCNDDARSLRWMSLRLLCDRYLFPRRLLPCAVRRSRVSCAVGNPHARGFFDFWTPVGY